jgi:sugar/nucleoside kinase (ribokinase family)
VPTIACIGGAHLDRRGLLHAPVVLGTSNPGSVRTDLGGVARNVAQNLAHLGSQVLLCSRVGDDKAGRQVLSQPRLVKELDLFESNHGCGLNAVFLVKHPKRT